MRSAPWVEPVADDRHPGATASTPSRSAATC